MPILVEIKDLHAHVHDKPLLKGVNLTLEKGKIHVLMGPNGSGKSTLANVIMGNPTYTISSGRIEFDTKDVTDLDAQERAALGIFLSFQYPREIQGVPLDRFLYMSYVRVHDALYPNEKKLSVFKFHQRLKEILRMLNLPEDFAKRNINVGSSGGEKKKMEMVQMMMLSPTFAMLDEVDSGLDIDALKLVGKAIQMYKSEEKSLLVVTHYQQILDYIKPDVVHIMKDGKIVATGSDELIKQIQKNGFDSIK